MGWRSLLGGHRLMALLLTLAVLLAGCTGSSAPNAPSPAPAGGSGGSGGSGSAGGPVKGGNLVVALQAEPETLDPHQARSLNAGRVYRGPIFEGLMRYKDDSMELEPNLAEKYEVSPDGLTYTFTLKKGVKFHDGTPFNAEAVFFSIDRQINPNNPANKDGTFANGPQAFRAVKQVEVVDEFTVKIHMKERFGPLLTNLAAPAGMIVSPTAVKKFGADFGNNPVGTGPFHFVSWERGKQVVLERFDGYYRQPAYLDRVVFRAIPEEATRLSELLSMGVQLATEITPVTAERLKTSKDHTVGEALTGALWFLAMNVNHTPLDDVRVRRALNHAIDKETIAKQILRSTAVTAYGPLSTAYVDHNPNLNKYAYDPEQAKKLLAEAGYANGFDIVFRVPASGSGMLLPVEMGTFIQENLAKVGIRAKVETTEFGTWMDQIRSPQNQLAEMSWNVAPSDPDAMLTSIYAKAGFPPGFNTSYYTNPELEDVLAKAVQETTDAKRRELYFRAQEIIVADAPVVPVVHRLDLTGLTRHVQGFIAHSDFVLRLDKVWLTK